MKWSMNFSDIWNKSQEDYYILFNKRILKRSEEIYTSLVADDIILESIRDIYISKLNDSSHKISTLLSLFWPFERAWDFILWCECFAKRSWIIIIANSTFILLSSLHFYDANVVMFYFPIYRIFGSGRFITFAIIWVVLVICIIVLGIYFRLESVETSTGIVTPTPELNISKTETKAEHWWC